MAETPAARRPSAGFRLAVAAAWAVAVFLLLPAFIAIPVSLTDQRYISLPREGLSLQHYRALVEEPQWWQGVSDSLLVALGATLVAVIVGTLAAIGAWRLAGRLATVLRITVLLPMILPPILSALALNQMVIALGLYDTVAGVILSHAILGIPFVVITVSTSLASLDPRLEQASRSLGAGIWRTAWSVILPNIRPGMVSGGVFAFIVSWDEIVVTLFVSFRAVSTLPRLIWNGIRDNYNPSVAAVASLLIAGTLLMLAVAAVLRAVRHARQEPQARPVAADPSAPKEASP